MSKHGTIVFLYLAAGCLYCATTFAQPKKEGGATTAAVRPTVSPGNALSSSQKNTSQKETLLDVLFATNEDCRIYINKEGKGVVSKDRFFYLKLPPGTYTLVAKSEKTGDEWRDRFTIAEGKPNEVFIDMLFTIDASRELGDGNNLLQTVKSSENNKLQAAPSEATQQATLQRILGEMLPIDGGTFVMGNNKSPSKDEAEHPVMISPFHMGRYEVTQEQWEGIMGHNPSLNKGCPDCPVENVSWEEVMVFLRKINTISNRKFRLPTEAEWEFVARMGGKEEIERAGGTEAYIRKTAWAFVNADNKTHPVGKKQPNVAGIYDLFGNVSEWCMDWYGAFFFKEDFTEKDPEGPPLGKDKIIRGGNYKDYVGDRFRPSFRNKMNPKTKTREIGFRLVMESED